MEKEWAGDGPQVEGVLKAPLPTHLPLASGVFFSTLTSLLNAINQVFAAAEGPTV